MIKVLFITNILCRHQVGVWDPLSKFEDIDFVYMCTSDPNITINLRYKCDEPRNYVLNSMAINNVELAKIINTADIIFYGSIDDERIRPLLIEKNNAFIITENYSKNNYRELFKLRGLRRKLSFKKNIGKILQDINKRFIFCSSSHTGEDFRLAGAKRESTLRFGYFPIYRYAGDNELYDKNQFSILYIGRNVYWKHPEVAKIGFNYFYKKNNNYHLTVYGEDLSLFFNSSHITVSRPIPNHRLCEVLVKNSIFIFPSDRNEGWGNVLGEAMAAGCICFANANAGSTRYLIQNGVNGFVFENNLQLKKQIRKFLKMDNKSIMTVRKNAINTMKYLYSGDNAAERLHYFIKCFINKEKFIPFDVGPLSID